MNKKQQKPLVSVIMPVWNAQRYVGEAVESVLGQTYENLELLVVDDNSSDESYRILRACAQRDKRMRVFRNTRNKGLGKSLNWLLPKTRGVYVARMDSDDVCKPKRIEEQVKWMEKHPEMVACGVQEDLIDENGKKVGEKRFPVDSQEAYQKIMLYMVIQPPTLMARGEAIRKCKYDTRGQSGKDDISMHFQLLQHGKLGNVDGNLFKYRVMSSSITHKNVKKTYWMAFGVRMKAVKQWGYRPSLKIWMLFFGETVLVSLLPEKWVMKVFEKFRHEKTFKRG